MPFASRLLAVHAAAVVTAVVTFVAATMAQACPRPTPPQGGFPTHIDAVLPVTYSDGYQTVATLVRPDAPPPTCGWPLVVFVHPLGSTRAAALGLQLEVASRGYAVWAYDVRGQGQAAQQNPGHVGAGSTLWGPVERCDLAEQVLHVGNEPAAVGFVDASRLAVIGSSQGGAHAWAAAAWSGLPLAVPGRAALTFPTVQCVIASDYAAENADDWLRGGRLWSSWFVEALAGSYPGLPLDSAFLLAARAAFENQDPAALLAMFAGEGRTLATKLAASTVPTLYVHSYHDRINAPLLGLESLATMAGPTRAILTTGGHNSPTNDLEFDFRDATYLRWLDRWLWDEPNEVELERPFVQSQLPLTAAERDDPQHAWSRAHSGDPLTAANPTRLWLTGGGQLATSAPTTAAPHESIEQVIDPTFTANAYLTISAERNPANVLTKCPLDEAVYSYVTVAESDLAAAARLRLHVVPHAPDWMIAALLTVEVPGSAEEVMLCSGAVHAGGSTPLTAEDHTLVLPPVAARLPAGTTVRLRLRNLWLREAPMVRQLEVAPRFVNFRVDVVHRGATSAEASWLDLPLEPVRPKLVAERTHFDLTTAAPLEIFVRGGESHASRPYFVSFGMSGHLPPTPFLTGSLPVQTDWLLGVVNAAWFTPELQGFLADLDGSGNATAVLDFSAYAPLPSEFAGVRLTFVSFVFDDSTLTSGVAANPCDVFLR